MFILQGFTSGPDKVIIYRILPSWIPVDQPYIDIFAAEMFCSSRETTWAVSDIRTTDKEYPGRHEFERIEDTAYGPHLTSINW